MKTPEMIEEVSIPQVPCNDKCPQCCKSEELPIEYYEERAVAYTLAQVQEILDEYKPNSPICNSFDHCWKVYNGLKEEIAHLRDVKE